MGFATDAIHVGQEPDENTGAVMPPINLATTFAYENTEKHKAYVYSRAANPTRCAFEKNMAALEKAKYAFAFSTGMAALSTLMMLLKPGEHCIISKDVYGGTFRLCEYVFKEFQLNFSYVDTTFPDNIIKAITPLTRMVLIETPSNPLLKVTDITAIAQICKEQKLIFCY